MLQLNFIKITLMLTILGGLLLTLPEQVEARPLMLRWGYYVQHQTSLDSVRQNIQKLDILAPFYFGLDSNGQISGSDQPEVTALAHRQGVRVVPMLQNNTTQAEFHRLISNPDIAKNIVEQIVTLVQSRGYEGFHIDFEDLAIQDRPYLSYFMSLLSSRLRPAGRLVTMAVPAKVNEAGNDWSAPYDYAALAPSLDLVTIMAYDYSYSTSRDGPVAPLGWVNGVAGYAATQFGPAKVLLGLPFYGYDWNLSKGSRAVGQDYATIQSLVRQYQGSLNFDLSSQSPYADYLQDGERHRVWFENPLSLAAKMEVVRRNNLAGWAVWRLGQEGADFWPVLQNVANPTFPVAPLPSGPALLYFKETGHSLGSLFLKYWEKNGGLARFGYPLTEELEERGLDDNKIHIVQYFERARFEYYPESRDNPVQLGLLGSQLTASRRSETAFQPVLSPWLLPTQSYYADSGHTLAGAFKRYWTETGGLEMYGLPISEPFSELSPTDGQLYLVQYFERSRFEYHPAKAGSGSVSPGSLGLLALAQKGWLKP